MSQLSPRDFAAAELALYRELHTREFRREHWDLINFINDRSLKICLAGADVPEKKIFRAAVPDKGNVTRRLEELLRWEVLLLDQIHYYYFNLNFDGWTAPRRADKGGRKLRKDTDPVEEPLFLQYGELPESKAFLRQFFLAKIAGKYSKILCVGVGSPLVAGRQAEDEGTSSVQKSVSPVRAAPIADPAEKNPPLPGAQLISEAPPPGGWWNFYREQIAAGKLTTEEASALYEKKVAIELPIRAAPQNLSPPRNPPQPNKIPPPPDPEKESAAWQWVVSLDKRNRLADLRCGLQWQDACRRHARYVLESLPHAWARALRRDRPPPDPLAWLSGKAISERKMHKLYSPEIEELLRSGAVGDLPTAPVPTGSVGKLPTQ
jgi:hypothetical protein